MITRLFLQICLYFYGIRRRVPLAYIAFAFAIELILIGLRHQHAHRCNTDILLKVWSNRRMFGGPITDASPTVIPTNRLPLARHWPNSTCSTRLPGLGRRDSSTAGRTRLNRPDPKASSTLSVFPPVPLDSARVGQTVDSKGVYIHTTARPIVAELSWAVSCWVVFGQAEPNAVGRSGRTLMETAPEIRWPFVTQVRVLRAP